MTCCHRMIGCVGHPLLHFHRVLDHRRYRRGERSARWERPSPHSQFSDDGPVLKLIIEIEMTVTVTT